ncbi:centromere protein R isoform X2 [Perognathus longimembris pacificus]|uniref:centromere protein R isoform X2 n=1 Tax=Perognathus longimembris pacificus TaxID=214514 RepID=UPI002019F2D9|nr:centromere protein R isoform X2 [Perognathus longimembris pacificus]
MSVRRALKLDDPLEENSFASSKVTRKKGIATYSPTTGTRPMTPFSSPRRSEKRKHSNTPSSGGRKIVTHFSLTKRKESTEEDNDEFMMLLSKAEKSSEGILKIMQNLHSIQALERNRELENLIGTFSAPCNLKREMKKTKELMIKVTRQKLFEKNIVLPHKDT